MTKELHIDMFMPFLHQFVVFGIVFHSLPLEELLPLSFSFYSVQYGSHDQTQPKESRSRYLVTIQNARERNAQENTRRHDECKDHGSEILDCIINEKLSNGGANGKQ